MLVSKRLISSAQRSRIDTEHASPHDLTNQTSTDYRQLNGDPHRYKEYYCTLIHNVKYIYKNNNLQMYIVRGVYDCVDA